MKRLTIRNVTLQMDMPETQGLNPETYAKDMIDLVNLTLQREPYGLCAQIMNGARPVRKEDLEVEEI